MFEKVTKIFENDLHIDQNIFIKIISLIKLIKIISLEIVMVTILTKTFLDLHILVNDIPTTIRYKKLDLRNLNLNLRNGKKFNQTAYSK